MIVKVPRIRKTGIPLKDYEDFSAFKLFLSDLELMGAMVDAPINGIFYYSAENSQAELDFLLQKEKHLIPAEVKAEENLQAKSLRLFTQKNPDSEPVRISMSPYQKQDWMINLPLYAAGQVMRVVE